MTEKSKDLLMPLTDDAPELDDTFFDRANVYHGKTLIRKGRPRLANPKSAITIRYDQDILDYFKATGKGWQTRMNNALREWIATH